MKAKKILGFIFIFSIQFFIFGEGEAKKLTYEEELAAYDKQKEAYENEYNKKMEIYEQNLKDYNSSQSDHITEQNKSRKQSMENAASQARKEEKAGQIVNMTMGGITMAAGVAMVAAGNNMLPYAPTAAEGTALTISGGMMIMQGLGQIAQGASLGKSASNTTHVESTFAGETPTPPDFNFAEFSPDEYQGFGGNPDITRTGSGGRITGEDLMTFAESQGFSLGPGNDVIITPKGPVNLSDFSASGGGKAGAGPGGGGSVESAKLYAEAMEKTKEIMKAGGSGSKSSVSSMAFKNSGGGGGSYSAGGDDSTKDPFADILNRFKNKRKPASKAKSKEGMSTAYHGDLIGVAEDNIFKMINRAYYRLCEKKELVGCD